MAFEKILEFDLESMDQLEWGEEIELLGGGLGVSWKVMEMSEADGKWGFRGFNFERNLWV